MVQVAIGGIEISDDKLAMDVIHIRIISFADIAKDSHDLTDIIGKLFRCSALKPSVTMFKG